MVEYALLIALIAALCAGALGKIGKEIAQNMCYTAGKTGPIDSDQAKYGASYSLQKRCCVANDSSGSAGSGACL